MRRDRAEPRDRRHAALVEVMERRPGSARPRAAGDRARRIPAALDRHLRDARAARRAPPMSPTTNTSGWPGRVRSGAPHPAGAVELGAGLLGEHAARAGRPGRRPPTSCDRLDAGRRVPSASWTSMPVAVHVDDLGAELDLDAHAAAAAPRPCRRAAGRRRRAPSARRAGRSAPRSGRCGGNRGAACGGRARRSARPSRPRSGRRRRRRRSAAASTLVRVGRQLGHLEGAEDPPAQLQGVVDGLHAGCELGELVVAEVGLPRAGSDDQAVVRRRRRAAEDARGDASFGQVDVGDVAEQDPRVPLPARTSRVPGRSRPRRGCRSPPGRAAAGTGDGWSAR